MTLLSWISSALSHQNLFAPRNSQRHPPTDHSNICLNRKRKRTSTSPLQKRQKRGFQTQNDGDAAQNFPIHTVVCLHKDTISTPCDTCTHLRVHAPNECNCEKNTPITDMTASRRFKISKLFPSLMMGEENSHSKTTENLSPAWQKLHLTDEALYSITPESIAKIHAQRCMQTTNSAPLTVWDCFAGWGGSVMQLLSQQSQQEHHQKTHIIASELDANHLEAAYHNVHHVVYGGMLDKEWNNSDQSQQPPVTWVHGDCIKILDIYSCWKKSSEREKDSGEWIRRIQTHLQCSEKELSRYTSPSCTTTLTNLMKQLDQVNVIILSPPWGGKDYQKHQTCDLRHDLPIDCVSLFQKAYQVTPHIIMCLPRNLDMDQIEEMISLCGGGGDCDTIECEVQENYFDDRLLTASVYFNGVVSREESVE